MKKFIIVSILTLAFAGLDAMETKRLKMDKPDSTSLSELPDELKLYIADFIASNEDLKDFQSLNQINKKFKDITNRSLTQEKKRAIKSDSPIDLLKIKKWYSKNEKLRKYLNKNENIANFLNQLKDNIGTLPALNMAVFIDNTENGSIQAQNWIMNHFSNIPIRSIMPWIKKHNIISDNLVHDIKRQHKFKKMLFNLKLNNNSQADQNKIDFLEKIGTKLSPDEEARIRQIKATRATNRGTSRQLF